MERSPNYLSPEVYFTSEPRQAVAEEGVKWRRQILRLLPYSNLNRWHAASGIYILKPCPHPNNLALHLVLTSGDERQSSKEPYDLS
jgi:hypothetical protein